MSDPKTGGAKAANSSGPREVARAISLFISHIFPGTDPGWVLVVAGFHGNEQSGIEVAHWIRVLLAARPKPTRLGCFIVPGLFGERDRGARAAEWKSGVAGSDWRELKVGKRTLFPARHFPPPGKPLEFLGKDKLLLGFDGKPLRDDDRKTTQLLPEVETLIRVIETLKPVRIVSCHGKLPRTKDHLRAARKAGIIDPAITDADIDAWDGSAVRGVNFPGIFVDPRYQVDDKCRSGLDLEACKFDPDVDPAFPQRSGTNARFDSARTTEGRADDALALAAATKVFQTDVTLAPGNHVEEPSPVVHYAKEGGTPNAFSLGDWGPVAVEPTAGKPGSRLGAPVFTIECRDNQESWAFIDGQQVMGVDNKPLIQEPSPADSAAGRRGKPFAVPARYDAARAEELRAYANGIIETILML